MFRIKIYHLYICLPQDSQYKHDTDSTYWLKWGPHHNNQTDKDNSKILPDMGTGVSKDNTRLRNSLIVINVFIKTQVFED